MGDRKSIPPVKTANYLQFRFCFAITEERKSRGNGSTQVPVQNGR